MAGAVNVDRDTIRDARRLLVRNLSRSDTNGSRAMVHRLDTDAHWHVADLFVGTSSSLVNVEER